MAIDPRNANTLWASVLVESLRRLGLTWAVISPGSRSAPLTFAFAAEPTIQKAVILDERAAAFFALGLARRLAQPVALVCTSGTAAANYYPAIIEAYYSQVPLLVLTADRPPHLRHCFAGQTIDQTKLYGTYPLWQAELALPTTGQLPYLQQMLAQAWHKATSDHAGPVHLNIPFDNPLVPLADPEMTRPSLDWPPPPVAMSSASPVLPWADWLACERGLIVVGLQNAPAAVHDLAAITGWPLLADTLSGQRTQSAIAAYDLILAAAIPPPEIVIQVGPLPTSKNLRQWLAKARPQTWVTDAGRLHSDPLHNPSVPVPGSIANWAFPDLLPRQTTYAQQWQQWQKQASAILTPLLWANLHEASVSAVLAACLPADTAVCVASSTPVRDLEWFWPQAEAERWFLSNRGANGIDGTIATALGVAATGTPTVLLTGDLAFLYDSSALLIRPRGSLTIILLDNQGGGIFALLPVAQFEPPYQDYFATPQDVDIAALCQAHNITHVPIATITDLKTALATIPPGLRLLEIQTDRETEAQWRRHCFAQVRAAITP